MRYCMSRLLIVHSGASTWFGKWCNCCLSQHGPMGSCNENYQMAACCIWQQVLACFTLSLVNIMLLLPFPPPVSYRAVLCLQCMYVCSSLFPRCQELLIAWGSSSLDYHVSLCLPFLLFSSCAFQSNIFPAVLHSLVLLSVWCTVFFLLSSLAFSVGQCLCV